MEVRLSESSRNAGATFVGSWGARSSASPIHKNKSGDRIRCAAPAASPLRAVGFAAGQVLILPQGAKETTAPKDGRVLPW